jgi:predicted ATP-grasp superfamily ATP-dependent carboligase
MKIVASVSIEVRVDDTELLDDAKERAIDELIDSLEDWINNNGIPPIISIEYKLPEIDENKQFLN